MLVAGKNPQQSFQIYSMELEFPDSVKEELALPAVPKNMKTLMMTAVDFREEIKKERSLSQKFLADSDVVFPNKDGEDEATFTYTHTIETSSGTTITKSNGGSLAVTIGTEFKTKYFGLAEQTISASVAYEGSWESGKETYNSKTVSHEYSFEFPVPAHCDATIAIMKNEMPTSIEWRASFYASGYIDFVIMGKTKTVDISRFLSTSQRYIYAFGTTDFGSRPTIVPIKTLQCINKKPQENVLEQCINPTSGQSENCRVNA